MNTTTMERPPLIKIVGTVEEILSAPARNKPGRIKLTDGKSLSAFADKLQMVEYGRTYDFGCERNEVNGVIYHNVKAVRETTAEAQLRQTRAQAQNGAQNAAPRQSAPIEPPQHEHRPNNGGNGNNYFRPTSPKDAKRMFICSQLNAIITSRQIDLDANSIAATIEMLTDAYDRTIGLDDRTD